jgi:hypothetical protein
MKRHLPPARRLRSRILETGVFVSIKMDLRCPERPTGEPVSIIFGKPKYG